MEFINQSKNDSVVVSTEQYRIFDDQGISRYILKGWFELRWKAKEGEPHFVA